MLPNCLQMLLTCAAWHSFIMQAMQTAQEDATENTEAADKGEPTDVCVWTPRGGENKK